MVITTCRCGARTVSCGPTQLADAAGRKIAVTEMVRTGLKRFMVVRLAQFPSRDAVYSLTLTSPQRDDTLYSRLFVAMYQSVKIPLADSSL